MRAIVVDDERLSMSSFCSKLKNVARIKEIKGFTSPAEALSYFTENGADIAFLDISMAEMDGLTLAKSLRGIVPGVIVIFVTGYVEYSLDAFRLHADGYLTKPVDEEDIREELDELERRYLPKSAPLRVRAQCFGNFELFVDDKPVRFKYAKTKELFAYLVDRRGASLNTAELSAVLWEDSPDSPSLRNQFRNLVSDLSKTLSALGVEDVFIKSRNNFAVNTKCIDCDMYRFREKNVDAVNAYGGEYMSQYSWAELTTGTLNELA